MRRSFFGRTERQDTLNVPIPFDCVNTVINSLAERFHGTLWTKSKWLKGNQTGIKEKENK
jgi:hypothetical protein